MSEIFLDKRFTKKLKGRLEKYNFEVGVLNDTDYRLPGNGVKSLAGGPARRTSTKGSGMKVSDVSRELRQRVDYLREPFKGDAKNQDIIAFTREFFRYAFGSSTEKRLINLLQAIVRNPLTRNDYGPNSAVTQKIKGFDRFGIDTGQLFKNIVAAIKRVR